MSHNDGWEARIDMASNDDSTTLAPALVATIMEVMSVPAVSWVLMCEGMSGNSSLNADTSMVAEQEVRRTRMSLTERE